MVLTIRQGSVVNENGRAVDPDTHSLIEQIKGQFNETLKTPLGSTAYKLTIKDEATGERRIRNGKLILVIWRQMLTEFSWEQTSDFAMAEASAQILSPEPLHMRIHWLYSHLETWDVWQR